jgi:DNA-binding transcriptional ArsR family regulator
MTTDKDFQRYYKRIHCYGFTPEEAYHCPRCKPLWMYRLEIQEGITFAEIVKRGIANGVSYSEIARSIGKNISTVYHWIQRLQKAGAI